MTHDLQIPQAIREALEAGALFVVSHSGGKDSQAMTALLRRLVPADRLVVVHADLPGVDWAGTLEHIQRTIGGLELHVCQANYRDGSPKSFLDLVDDRGQFPLPQQRQCTSDLKRGPIEVVTRRISKEKGIKRIVSCIGIRAEESTARAGKAEVEPDKRLSKAGRDVLTWRPILELTVDQVFAVIAEAGQIPHWAYQAGMSRLSCRFCIMACAADLTRSAELNPEHYYEIRAKELEHGHTLSPSRKSLAEIVGLDPTGLVGRAIAAGELEQDLEDIETIDLVAMVADPVAQADPKIEPICQPRDPQAELPAIPAFLDRRVRSPQARRKPCPHLVRRIDGPPGRTVPAGTFCSTSAKAMCGSVSGVPVMAGASPIRTVAP